MGENTKVLKGQLALSPEQKEKLESIVKSNTSAISEKYKWTDYTLYVSHEELKEGVFAAVAAAAEVGPEALAAALEAVATAIGGVVGAVLAAAIEIVSIAEIAKLAGTIVYALGSGRGFWLCLKPGSDFFSFGTY